MAKRKWNLGPPPSPDDGWNVELLDPAIGLACAAAISELCWDMQKRYVLRGSLFKWVTRTSNLAADIRQTIINNNRLSQAQLDLLEKLKRQVEERSAALDAQRKAGTNG